MNRNNEGHALTCGQRWLLHLLKESPALARPVQRVYRLRRPLDTSALLAAFRHVISVHPALRLQLRKTETGWKQYFPDIEAEISGLLIRGRTREERAGYARYILAQEAREPFDLRQHPAFLAKLIEIDGDYQFSLCLDHLAADDLASDVLERELGEAYLRETRDLPHADPTAAQTFYDYIAREVSQASREPANLDYWRSHLAGAPPGRLQSEELEWVPGENTHWQVSGDPFLDLTRACRRQQCSIFAALLAAQVKLLSELGQTSDLVCNIPVSNRTRATDHMLIANLSMLLHVRFRVEADEDPSRFLRSVRDQILEAMTRRQYDYAALSRIVSSDAGAHNRRVHWLTGCSYLQERNPPLTQSPLFEERLDDHLPQSFNIPRTGFSIIGRQSTTRLLFAADWDPVSWPVHGPELAERYLEILAAITGAAALMAGPKAS